MFLSQLSEGEKESFVQLIYHIITKDGKYTEERQLILQYTNEMEINFGEFDSGEEQDEDILIGLFSSSTEDIVRKVFIEIIGLSLLNRAYDRIEEEILHRYATEYNLGTESLEEAKGWVEKMNILYQEVAYLI